MNRFFLVAVLCAILAIATGCGRAVDADQLRLCRQTLPVLNPDGASFRISRSIAWRETGVRIEYRVKPPAGPETNRFVACEFAAGGLQINRQEMTKVTTEREELSESTLYLLKRFWLETPDATLADPGAAADIEAQEALSVPRNLAIFLQHGVSALPGMAIYALLASAYALIYGLIGRINLAFGEFAALGGIAAGLAISIALIFKLESVGLLLLISTCAALGVAVLHATVVSRLILQPLAGRPGQHVLVATIGLAIALQEYLRLTQGNGTRWVSPIFNNPLVLARAGGFAVTITPIALAVTAVAICAALLLLAFLAHSRYGRHWRAVADDPLAAALFGVSAATVYAETFALACGLAGLAGLIVTLYYGGLGYAGGTALGLKSLVGAVAGGIGSVPGAMLGGLLVGLIETLWSGFLPIMHRDIALFALLIILLALKPGGLFGFGQLLPRKV